MAKRTPKSQKLCRWRITRLKASPAALIGYVEAPDQEQAIRTAIRQFGITNPEHQKAAGGAEGGIGLGSLANRVRLRPSLGRLYEEILQDVIALDRGQWLMADPAMHGPM